MLLFSTLCDHKPLCPRKQSKQLTFSTGSHFSKIAFGTGLFTLALNIPVFYFILEILQI